MNTPYLHTLIKNFNNDNLESFLREKSDNIEFPKEELYVNNEKFTNYDNAVLLAKSDLPDGILVVCTLQVTKDLTERSSKKEQYELAKNILKSSNSDAGIFVFYDNNSNFRFSLVYAEYQGNKRTWNNFKRFTYFVSPHQTNKTFLDQIGKADFSTIELLKEAFSVEPVTKQFYNEIQSWYFWAMDKIKFPTDYKYSDNPEKDDEIRNSNNLIRLITRVIFIWFIKQKNLINDDLFSEDKLKNILKDFNKNNESANYYNAILQNLFFATLNQKMNERKFAENNGFQENKKEYGVKNLYRYDDLFQISKEDILQLFNMTPFLNGGLFDCLDKENENGKVIYIDGFSRNPQKKAIIPDFLFFQKNETKVNLSKYGLSKDSPTKGLIKILQEYNFTIDENTPIDQEVALDPELLGKVFENLLASYNPETATTARKATGSYYTPREIVDYMVQESLFNYLIDKCPNIDQSKLKELLSYSENSIDLTDTERDDIIAALDNIKILDPACGSGAFPMGALHKIVYALQKLDPDNSRWKNLQIDKVNKETNVIFHQTDKNEREARLKELNEMFDESINYPDYARKLFIIENCIYGVDIQTIAIQISKLRFFISLVLDQKVDNTKENMGIRALPNMETKFVAANTLIGLYDTKARSDVIYYNQKVIEIRDKLNQLRHKYFSAKTRKDKLDYQRQDRELRKEMSEELYKNSRDSKITDKIANFDIYDPNASADWFDPEWMFGVKDGFDIVIGNPPYGIKFSENEKEYFKKNYLCTKTIPGKQKGSLDSFALFIEQGFNILKQNGILIYIVPISITSSDSMTALHNFLEKNCKLIKISSYAVRPQPIFQNAVVNTSILLFVKTLTPVEQILCTKMYRKSKKSDLKTLFENLQFIDVKNYKLYGRYPKISLPIETKIIDKLFSIKTKIKDLIRENGEPIYYRSAGGRYYKVITPYKTDSSTEKIIYFDKQIANTIGAILSSNLYFWYYQIFSDNLSLKSYEIESFPIPINELTEERIKVLEILYGNYLKDIEENAKKRITKKYAHIDTFKEYKIRKSKKYIDAIDDIIGPLYGLNEKEIEFIKNYEIKFRTTANEED